jgi:hypothetical protein
VKVLAFQRGEPVLTDDWQKTMLAWLAFTMKWPVFLANTIVDALALDMATGPHEGYLLQALDASQSDIDKPDKEDVALFLPLSARRIVDLWEIAGNFLIENPHPVSAANATSHR